MPSSALASRPEIDCVHGDLVDAVVGAGGGAYTDFSELLGQEVGAVGAAVHPSLEDRDGGISGTGSPADVLAVGAPLVAIVLQPALGVAMTEVVLANHID